MPTSNPTGPPPTLKCTDCNRDFDPVAHWQCPYCEALELFRSDVQAGIQESLRMRCPTLEEADLLRVLNEEQHNAKAGDLPIPEPESGSTILALARKLRERIKANVPEFANVYVKVSVHGFSSLASAARIGLKITQSRQLFARQSNDLVWMCHEEPPNTPYPGIQFYFHFKE